MPRGQAAEIERENGAPGRIGRGVDLVLMRLDDRFDETHAEADAPPRIEPIPRFVSFHSVDELLLSSESIRVRLGMNGLHW